ncbi:hypothetical protein GCM10008956_06610 [Deinococcus arenae]|uniref:Uncharacterized protein n=1 Tax=Deinococcus arenae TaxID=1452751 RepID=A0A8H9GJQ0_9DEIO|nr:hypothetical protein [Deinococcus arenae]AWT35648.1 hypothetical protein DM785_08810 [Deinococcus actinosclerus]GGM33027.1 hypothetical protein GCM10008956_06610 [Deinococcus arenae]
MTHDDWQTGIQNEADSVQDTDWSRDTRRHLRRRAWLTATLITLGFTILALSLTAVLNAALVGALAPVPPGAMNIIVSPFNPQWLMVAGLGYLLTRRGFTPLQATTSLLTAILLFSITVRLITLNVQSNFPNDVSFTVDVLPAPQDALSGPVLMGLILNIVALGAGIGLARVNLHRTRTA